MIQNKKVQDLFPEGTKVSVALNGDNGSYIGYVDFTDLVGISLIKADYSLGGFTTGPAKQTTFIPYTSVRNITAAGVN